MQVITKEQVLQSLDLAKSEIQNLFSHRIDLAVESARVIQNNIQYFEKDPQSAAKFFSVFPYDVQLSTLFHLLGKSDKLIAEMIKEEYLQPVLRNELEKIKKAEELEEEAKRKAKRNSFFKF